MIIKFIFSFNKNRLELKKFAKIFQIDYKSHFILYNKYKILSFMDN